MATAGRAVVFSGTTVAIGLLALVALPVPFLRSVGYGGMVIPLVSLAVVTTLLPVILVDDRRPARLAAPAHRRPRQPLVDARGARWSSAIGSRRRASRLAVLGGARVRRDNDEPRRGDGQPEHDQPRRRRPAGARRARALRHRLGRAHADRSSSPTAVRPRGSSPRLAHVAGVQGAVAPAAADWRRGSTALVDVFAQSRLEHARSTASAHAAHADGRRRPRRRASSAQNSDFISAVYGNFPLMLGADRVLTFVLLARAFRSVLLPAEGARPERPQRRGGVGRRHARLAGGLRLAGALGHPRRRLDPVVAAADDVRVPLRALDGLRGLHPRPHARGVRRAPARPTPPSSRASAAPAGSSRAPR